MGHALKRRAAWAADVRSFLLAIHQRFRNTELEGLARNEGDAHPTAAQVALVDEKVANRFAIDVHADKAVALRAREPLARAAECMCVGYPMLLVRWLSLHELAHAIAAHDMAARRMASSMYEAHVLEPEDLPKMGCSEGAGDEDQEEAHVAASIHCEPTRCNCNPRRNLWNLRLI